MTPTFARSELSKLLVAARVAGSSPLASAVERVFPTEAELIARVRQLPPDAEHGLRRFLERLDPGGNFAAAARPSRPARLTRTGRPLRVVQGAATQRRS